MFGRRIVPLVGDYRNNLLGYMKLAEYAADLFSDLSREVAIDCRKLDWFSGSMGALLGALNWKFQAMSGYSVNYDGLKPHMRTYFGKIRLIQEKYVDTWGTAAELKGFGVNQHQEFSRYTEQAFVGKDLPRMSPSLKNKFFESLDEIYGNASNWSKTTHSICVAGQFFPKEKHTDFSIVDLGRGFRQALLKDQNIDLIDCEAIEWATQGTNTTRSGDVPGGIGLKIIREFVELNGGKLQIVSHNGYWSLGAEGIYKRQIPVPVPGTVVNLVIDTSDTKSYHLTSEVHPDEIF